LEIELGLVLDKRGEFSREPVLHFIPKYGTIKKRALTAPRRPPQHAGK